MLDLADARLGVIGLGYVGLPLAVEFGRQFPTIGLDTDPGRIEELNGGRDSTLEVEAAALRSAERLKYTANPEELADCNVYIVAVPTPIDEYKQPDLTPLRSASRTLGSILSKGDVAIFESTVYPGATEEVCIPLMEQESGLVFNRDFFVGYSPERINPGDKLHRLTTIRKVTSFLN